jgi:hypothetical protein
VLPFEPAGYSRRALDGWLAATTHLQAMGLEPLGVPSDVADWLGLERCPDGPLPVLPR